VLRLPVTYTQSLICFASRVHAAFLCSCLAAVCAPGRPKAAFQAGVIVQPATPLPVYFRMHVSGISQVSRQSVLCLCPGLRPRLNRRSLASLMVSSMLPPRFPRQGLQRLMNFGALSRGFGTCWLAFTGRELNIAAKGFRSHSHPPFLDLSWRKGSFILKLSSRHSITSSASNCNEFGTSSPSTLAVCRLMTNSNLVDCWTGSSSGFAPLRI
jgi:hypothetical protein